MKLPSIKISQSGISQIFQHHLKEPQVAKYLNLKDADKVFDALKELTERQYRYLNWLFASKFYKKIAMIFLENGVPVNPDYAIHLAQLNN